MSLRDLIIMYQQMQIWTHLAHTLDPACQAGVRTTSGLALRSFVSLFMPEILLLTMWHHGKTTKYWFFSFHAAISLPLPCLNMLIQRVKQRYSHLSFNSCFSISCFVFSKKHNFRSWQQPPHLFCSRQFVAKAWNTALWACIIFTQIAASKGYHFLT